MVVGALGFHCRGHGSMPKSQILHYMEKKFKRQCTMISVIVVQLYLNRIGGTGKMVQVLDRDSTK